MLTLDEFEYAYGLHSNIPECCVKAWIAGRRGYHIPNEFYRKFGHCNYVVCPSCLWKISNKIITPNVLHICTDEDCHDWQLMKDIVYTNNASELQAQSQKHIIHYMKTVSKHEIL